VLFRFLVLLLCFLPGTLFAQGKATPSPLTTAPLIVSDLEIKAVSSPRGSIQTDMTTPGRAIGPTKWLELSTEYRSNVPWIDEITFKYYVLFKQEDRDHLKQGEDGVTLVTGEVVYTDVMKSRKHISAMFLTPSKTFRLGKPAAYAVQIQVGGRTVQGKTVETVASLKGTQWWESRPPKRMLLNRTQTPFYGIDFDSFSDIKTDNAR